MKIKKGHTLAVALECLKQDKRTNPVLIGEMEKIAEEYQGRDRVMDAHKERQRIAAQRALFGELPPSIATDLFKQAMLDRAWHLLDAGQGEACDALLEFVPEIDATRLLDKYFPELANDAETAAPANS